MIRGVTSTGIWWSALVLVVVSGCASPASKRCDDGTICPPGTKCVDSQCVSDKCGNGVVDPGETCDYGNDNSEGQCSFDCSSDLRCGNAILDPSQEEECDCGDEDSTVPLPIGCTSRNNDDNGLCTRDCKLHCGDGRVNDEERCDGAPPAGFFCADTGFDTGLLECSDFCTVFGADQCIFFNWQEYVRPTNHNLRSIWGTGSDNLYVVGWDGTLSRYDGRLWEHVYPGRWAERLFAIWGRGFDDIYVGGDHGLLLHYDGSEWQEIDRLELKGEPRTEENEHDINGLWGRTDSDLLWAVGDQGRIWTHNTSTGARSLDLWEINGDGVELDEIWGTADDDIYAVGEFFTLIHFNGNVWSEVQTGLTRPPMNNENTDDFNAIWGSSAEDVFVVGDQGTIWHYGRDSVQDPLVWREMTVPEAYVDATLRAVWGTGPNNVFVVGEDGLSLYYDGRNWIPLKKTIHDHLYQLWGTSARDLYVVGNNGAIARHTGWARVESEPLTAVDGTPLEPINLWDIWGSRPDDIYTVGDHDGDGLVVHYDGRNWTEVPVPAFAGEPAVQRYRAVWTTKSGETVFVGGRDGTLLRYSSTSGVWQDISDAQLRTANIDLRALWGIDANSVYAVGEAGWVVRYDGNVWTRMDAYTTRTLTGIWGSDTDDIYVVSALGGGTQDNESVIVHYDGQDWDLEYSGMHDLNAIWGSVEGGGVYVSGDDGLLLYRDEKGNWISVSPETTQDLYDIWGNNQGEVFAIGSNGALAYNDGRNWQPVRETTFEQWNAVWGTDSILVSVGRGGILEMLVRTDR